eukprot:TRINITY_DN258_c0_g1_i7.p1 TRINITY_DN258_c0_g1~~TRINITY_DN258_c0_g1_i7.p1  ORF type:complete len:343 (-),score=93.72 TRINITY_DN258_c0_g1_i7:75-1076(-)
MFHSPTLSGYKRSHAQLNNQISRKEEKSQNSDGEKSRKSEEYLFSSGGFNSGEKSRKSEKYSFSSGGFNSGEKSRKSEDYSSGGFNSGGKSRKSEEYSSEKYSFSSGGFNSGEKSRKSEDYSSGGFNSRGKSRKSVDYLRETGENSRKSSLEFILSDGVLTVTRKRRRSSGRFILEEIGEFVVPVRCQEDVSRLQIKEGHEDVGSEELSSSDEAYVSAVLRSDEDQSDGPLREGEGGSSGEGGSPSLFGEGNSLSLFREGGCCPLFEESMVLSMGRGEWSSSGEACPRSVFREVRSHSLSGEGSLNGDILVSSSSRGVLSSSTGDIFSSVVLD